MSQFKMFFGDTRFMGEYDPLRPYQKNELVKVIPTDGKTNTSVFRCIGKDIVGMFPPDSDQWELFIPIEVGTVLGVATVDEAKAETFGDGAGDVWEWIGEEWRLEIDGELITLVRVLQNCNCICDCQCECNCNCLCVNCEWAYCNCDGSDPPYPYYHLPDPIGYLNCPYQCVCNCGGGDCACNSECSACGSDCNQCVCVNMCQCDICQGTLCEGVCVCNCG